MWYKYKESTNAEARWECAQSRDNTESSIDRGLIRGQANPEARESREPEPEPEWEPRARARTRVENQSQSQSRENSKEIKMIKLLLVSRVC